MSNVFPLGVRTGNGVLILIAALQTTPKLSSLKQKEPGLKTMQGLVGKVCLWSMQRQLG